MGLTLSQPLLSGQHARLEPLAIEHASGLHAVGQKTEDWKYLPIPGLKSHEHAREWVTEAISQASAGDAMPYVICCANTGRPLGSTRYMAIRAKHHALEIGYTWLGQEAQRTAINTECKYLLLKHAFETMGAFRVELKTDLRNLRSQKAIERIGGIKEGILRKHMVAQGGHHRDTVMYSITDDEWPVVSTKLKGLLQK